MVSENRPLSSNAVSRTILKLVYRFGFPNSDPQTLKIIDFRCKLSSLFVFAEPREMIWESNVLSYWECKIAKIFWSLAPGPHWVGLTMMSLVTRPPVAFGSNIDNMQWLTSGEWGFLLDNGPKMAVWQSNIRLEKILLSRDNTVCIKSFRETFSIDGLT